MNITVTKNPHPGTLPPSNQLGFGTVFTDHMFVMDYTDRKSTRLNSSHPPESRMPSSA